MKRPRLDLRTRAGLNKLGPEIEEQASPYHEEVVWYGIQALTHCVVMGEAREVAGGAVPLEDFIAKYQIAFNPFSASLRAIQGKGIFIPEHAFQSSPYKDNSGRVLLFNDDDLNRCLADYSRHSDKSQEPPLNQTVETEDAMWWAMGENPTYPYRQDINSAYDLIYNTSWSPEDLKKLGLVQSGVEVGKYLWRISKESFGLAVAEESQHLRRLRQLKQPENITNLATELIEYYDGIISRI